MFNLGKISKHSFAKINEELTTEARMNNWDQYLAG